MEPIIAILLIGVLIGFGLGCWVGDNYGTNSMFMEHHKELQEIRYRSYPPEKSIYEP